MYNIYELMWMFVVYGFCGWFMETVIATVRNKKFVNKGICSGPICGVYGITVCLMTVFLGELDGIWLYFGCTIFATFIEIICVAVIRSMGYKRWWNYEKIKGNIEGDICLAASLVWGFLGMLAVMYLNDCIFFVVNAVQGIFMKTLISIIVVIYIFDVFTTIMINANREEVYELKKIQNVLCCLTKGLRRKIKQRLNRAYIRINHEKKKDENRDVFAYGYGIHKIVWLFTIAAFLGDITEMIFCRISAGVWMNRSSLVWGPFSIVWGFAIVSVTAILYRYKDRTAFFMFVMGTVLGGAYEYACSVFTEIVFGKIFWDYSHIKFNLGGRINLLFCIFWGVAAVVWMKYIYPKASNLIEKVPKKAGQVITWIALIVMTADILISACALIRMKQREEGNVQNTVIEKILDEKFDDETMSEIYPSMKKIKK